MSERCSGILCLTTEEVGFFPPPAMLLSQCKASVSQVSQSSNLSCRLPCGLPCGSQSCSAVYRLGYLFFYFLQVAVRYLMTIRCSNYWKPARTTVVKYILPAKETLHYCNYSVPVCCTWAICTNNHALQHNINEVASLTALWVAAMKKNTAHIVITIVGCIITSTTQICAPAVLGTGRTAGSGRPLPVRTVTWVAFLERGSFLGINYFLERIPTTPSVL